MMGPTGTVMEIFQWSPWGRLAVSTQSIDVNSHILLTAVMAFYIPVISSYKYRLTPFIECIIQTNNIL